MKTNDLAKLATLADAVFEAELAKMRGNRAAAADVDGEVASVRQSRRQRADAKRAFDAPDPAQLASADLHWDRWTDEKLRRLQAERARLEAEAAAMRAGAKRAFGRRQALVGLCERVHKEARRRAANRT
jgi:hypothetical protein